MDPVSVIIFLAILALSGLLSGTETAITAVSESNILRQAQDGNKQARRLELLLKDKGRVIAALLVANNIVNVALVVHATVMIDGAIQRNQWLPPWAGPIVAAVVSIVLLLAIGEVLPRSVAVTFRKRWALTSSLPVTILMAFALPATSVLTRAGNALTQLLGAKPGQQDIFDLREIQAIPHSGERVGVPDTIEKRLIERSTHLNDTRVREIMIPRTDIQGLEITTPLGEIRALFQKSPYSRIPVYRSDLDDVVGILHYKEFFRHAPERARGFDIATFLHKALFVPESMFIGDLLTQMRAKRSHMAIVIDEYGGTSGLTTLEDVVEMLVGRIEDEYDPVDTPYERIDESSWQVDGRVIDERLVAWLGLELPPEALEGFDTVAGLTLKAFGNIPAEGDVTTYYGLEITVLRVTGHRVRRVKIRVLPPDEAAAAAQAQQSARRRPTQRVTQTVPKPGQDA